MLYWMLALLCQTATPLAWAQSDSGSVLMAPARDGGLWGYIDQKGEWLIPPQYGYAKNFHENLAEVVMYNEESIISGFINRNNKLIIQLPEINYSNVSEGMLAFLEKDAYGYMDSTGKKIIPAQFKYCSNFSNGRAMVIFKAGKAGYINKSKQLLLSPRWDTAFSFQGRFAVVGKQDLQGRFKYGIIDQYGNSLVPTMFSFITPLSEDKAFAYRGGAHENGKVKNGTWYLVNMAKQSMLTLCDTTVNADIVNNAHLIKFVNGVTWFPGRHKGQVLFGLMNERGDWEVLPKYKMVNHIHEEMAGVYVGRKMGFIDTKGRNIVPCMYDYVDAFHNGLAGFKEGNKYGFLNKNGDVVIPPKFDEVGDFMSVQ